MITIQYLLHTPKSTLLFNIIQLYNNARFLQNLFMRSKDPYSSKIVCNAIIYVLLHC